MTREDLKRARLRRLGHNLFLAGFVFFAVAEAGLRICDYFSPSFVYYTKSYNRFRGKPFSRDYNFRLNSKGFKDLEYPEKKGEGYRIVAIGDSLAFGVVPYEHNYLTLLEKRFQAQYGSAEVINMGIPGTGPKEYLSLLRNEGFAYSPDMVLVTFFVGNDFVDMARKKNLYEYSYMLSFLRYLVRFLAARDRRQIHKGEYYEDNAPSLDADEFLKLEVNRSRIFINDCEDFPQLLESAMHYLIRMKRLCEENETELIVAIAPDEVQLDRDLQSKVATMLKAPSAAEIDCSFPNRILTKRLGSEGIGCLDLYVPFLMASVDKRLYKPRDTHWNIMGNKLAAELIGDYISRNHLEPRIEKTTNRTIRTVTYVR